jgi:8-oxo-dGTP diphosphatase
MSIEKSNFQTIITTRLLLENNGQFLFLEQTANNGGGLTLPGGKVKTTEFAKKALVRETLEEIGIPIIKKDLQLVHVTHRKWEDLSEIILFFHCLADLTAEPSVKEPEKFQNTVWLSSSEVPEELTGVLRHSLENISKGKLFSQFPKVKKIEDDPLDVICDLC